MPRSFVGRGLDLRRRVFSEVVIYRAGGMLHDPYTVYVGTIGVWLLCLVVIYVAIRSV